MNKFWKIFLHVLLYAALMAIMIYFNNFWVTIVICGIIGGIYGPLLAKPVCSLFESLFHKKC